MPWAARGSAKVQLRRSRVQKCKGGMLVRGRGRGRGMRTFRISGLRSRPKIPRQVHSGVSAEFACLPLPPPLPQSMEILLHLCTGRRPICTFAPSHPYPSIPLGRHAVPTLPTASLVPSCPRALVPSPLPPYSILDTPYSGIWNFVFPLPSPLGRVKPCRPRNS